jgi:mannose-6-phosphate isomerase-like protein (cupin superfamily)
MSMKRIGLLLAVGAGLMGTAAVGQTAAAGGGGVPVAAPPAVAGDGGLTVWAKGVPPGGVTRVGFGDFTVFEAHRDGNGRVEVHQTTADLMVVQSGGATLVTGGEVVDPVQTGPNEIGGSAIKGGVSRVLAVGDVVEIPPGVPHQYFIEKGGQITYLLVKVPKK